ncbi:hypothetical protein [Natronobeatus ordinarius]|uniref:hypothetical protein n=1 Tax=Natronobeatus ordinarius TaxID=2963433 RepID=UPI0020CC33DE|nr:hypothetical protein [Natronobeatus ordinarius]
MSQDRPDDRRETDDDEPSPFYLPGAPEASVVDRVWNAIGGLFRTRGRVRADRPREADGGEPIDEEYSNR